MSPNNPNALVFIWDGNVASDEIVIAMSNLLIDNGVCIPEFLTVKSYDGKGVANLLVKEVTKSRTSKKNDVKDEIQASIVVIGTYLEKELRSGSMTKIIIAVNRAVQDHVYVIASGRSGNPELIKALEVLASKNEQELLKYTAWLAKYNLDLDRVRAISESYLNSLP